MVEPLASFGDGFDSLEAEDLTDLSSFDLADGISIEPVRRNRYLELRGYSLENNSILSPFYKSPWPYLLLLVHFSSPRHIRKMIPEANVNDLRMKQLTLNSLLY